MEVSIWWASTMLALGCTPSLTHPHTNEERPSRPKRTRIAVLLWLCSWKPFGECIAMYAAAHYLEGRWLFAGGEYVGLVGMPLLVVLARAPMMARGKESGQARRLNGKTGAHD